MKSLLYKFLHVVAVVLSAILINPPSAMSQNPDGKQPPPLAPFNDIGKPTKQTADAGDLLSFLPEILATYDNGSQLTKSRLIEEMGMGLDLAARQGRQLSPEELTKVVAQLLDSLINLDFMYESAHAKGLRPELSAAAAEIDKLRAKMGSVEFNRMLKLQALSEDQFAKRIARKLMIDQWIETVKSEHISVSEQEIEDYYVSHRDLLGAPVKARFTYITMTWSDPTSAPERMAIVAKLSDVVKQAKRGENFESLVEQLTKEYGDSPHPPSVTLK